MRPITALEALAVGSKECRAKSNDQETDEGRQVHYFMLTSKNKLHRAGRQVQYYVIGAIVVIVLIWARSGSSAAVFSGERRRGRYSKAMMSYMNRDNQVAALESTNRPGYGVRLCRQCGVPSGQYQPENRAMMRRCGITAST